MKRVLGLCCVALLGGGAVVSPQERGGQVVVRDRTAARAMVVDQTRVAGEVRMKVPLEGRTVTGAPYSAEVVNESVQVLADGNRIVREERSRVTRDSQGRVRREVERDGQVVSISITDPVGKTTYSLDPASHVAWKTPLGATRVLIDNVTPSREADPAEIERRRKVEQELVQKIEQVQEVRRKQETEAAAAAGRAVPPPPPPPPPAFASAPPPPPPPPPPAGEIVIRDRNPGWEEKVEELAPRQIEGVQAVGKRTTRTIPVGAIGNERPIVIVSEEWRSPELQVLVLTTTSDPRVGDSAYRLLNINRSEPSPSLFEVPPDYTVKETGVRRAPLER